MVYLPNNVFNKIIGFCDDTPMEKHRKIMKEIILDIELFYDLYSNILIDKVIDWHSELENAESTQPYEDFMNERMDCCRVSLMIFIEWHDKKTDRYNYDLDRTDRIEFTWQEKTDTTHWYRLPPIIRD